MILRATQKFIKSIQTSVMRGKSDQSVNLPNAVNEGSHRYFYRYQHISNIFNRSEGPEGDRGIALLFLGLGTRRSGWSAPRPGRFTPGKDPVPIVQEAGWAPGPVWTCAKNLAPTGIRSPDRPSRSQSLYRPLVKFLP
jgi:hypothetical protein